MMYYYCTLFNKTYLTRALAMIESLIKHAHDFHLYILAFDDESFNHISALCYPFITAIRLDEFEDDRLRAIKPTRTLGEYCWSCTPAIIEYCIRTFCLPHCTYIDADVFFFNNPNIIIDEARDHSIILTKHNYAPQYRHFQHTSGIYCVQFMFFRADSRGLEALSWWKEQCLQWCFAYYEDGKFGDQKYLDDWTTRFQGVYVPSDATYALAPWNISQYPESQCVFYHFHNLSFISEDKVDLGGYVIPKSARFRLYAPYLAAIMRARAHGYDTYTQPKRSPISLYRSLKRRINGTYNIFKIADFIQGESYGAHD